MISPDTRHQVAHDPEGSNSFGHCPWTWWALALLLALFVSSNFTEFFVFSFEPFWYLPLLSGWLAHRYGSRITGLMLFLGVLAAFRISLRPLDFTYLSFGNDSTAYFLAVCSAIAFARPRVACSMRELFRPWWLWAAWLVILVLVLAIIRDADSPMEFRDNAGVRMQFDIGALLALPVLAAALQWRRVVDLLKAEWTARHRWQRIRAAILAAVLGGALLVRLDYEATDRLGIEFGYSDAWVWLFVLCFAFPAWRILDWRLVIALLLALCVGEWIWSRLWDMSPEAAPVEGDATLDGLAVTRSRSAFEIGREIISVFGSAALMGAAFAPFWQTQHVEPLRAWRTPVLMAAILVLKCVVIPAGGYGFSGFIFGGIAYLAGLVWRTKALVVAPLAIQLCYLLSFVGHGEGDARMTGSELVRLGAITFPFAFFGVLSNRIQSRGHLAMPARAEVAAP